MSDEKEKQQIFRQVSLERLASPEQLDLLLNVTSPMSWLILIGFGFLIVVVIVWSFVGVIPTEITEPTILLKEGGIKNISSAYEGQIIDLFANEYDVVQAGDVIATVLPIGADEVVDVTSAYSGRILEFKTDVGNFVHQGDTLASLEFVGDDVDFEAIMYLPPSDSDIVKPGMVVKIAPTTLKTEEYGYLLGTVMSVGKFPSTYEGMVLTLGSDDLVNRLNPAQAPIEVHINLIEDPSTTSGYLWSTSEGPDFAINSGTLGMATITVERQKPIELVFPVQ